MISADPSTTQSAAHPDPPYMVALAGWPEPVYISPTSHGRRSQPSSPRPSTSLAFGEVRDGITLPPISSLYHRSSSHSALSSLHSLRPLHSLGSSEPLTPFPTLPSIQSITSTQPVSSRDPSSSSASRPAAPKESLFSQACMYTLGGRPCPLPDDHPNHVTAGINRMPVPPPLARPPVLMDRRNNVAASNRISPSNNTMGRESPITRDADTTPPYPLSSARSTPHSPKSDADHMPPPPLPIEGLRAHFADPRYDPKVQAISMRPLRMAPSWTSASGIGGKPKGGAKKDGDMVSSAAPDVYPVIGSDEGLEGLNGGGRVATEVYARDPDRGFLWGPGSGGGSRRRSAQEGR